MTPVLARGATPLGDREHARFRVAGNGFAGTVSLSSRPSGWIVTAGDTSDLGLPDGYATLQVDRPGEGEWSWALVDAVRWLAALPEARGLPVAIAGSGEARDAALSAAATLG